MSVNCLSALTVSPDPARVPGSITFLIKLGSDESSEECRIELEILSAGIKFAGGLREDFLQTVESQTTHVSHSTEISCTPEPRNTSVRVRANVWQGATLICDPAVSFTADYHCQPALVEPFDASATKPAKAAKRAKKSAKRKGHRGRGHG